VLDVVKAYWTCVGATESLDILRTWEQQAEKMEATVVRLSHAKLFSPAYVEQAQSYSREKKTRRVNAELDEYKARQALGVAMGIKGLDLTEPPVPAQRFPKLQPPDLPKPGQYDQVIKYALAHRQDVKAAQSTQEGLAILAQAARHDLKPRVDLSLNLSYNGVDRGQRPQAFLSNLHNGLTAMGGVSMDFPLENRTQSGQLRQALAQETQASILRQQLAQSVASDVMVALQEVARTYEAYNVSLEAEKYYAQSVDKERKRFLLGDASFVDVITIEDKYREAELETISARQAHLIALARLRYATGSLLGGSASKGRVSMADLTKVPRFR
jgi:outer membrane protein TolC